MRRASQAVFSIVLLLTLPTVVRAQRVATARSSAPRTATFVRRAPSTAPRPVILRMQTGSNPTSTIATTNSVATPSSVILTSGGFPISVQQLLDPFPAFGFDFSHLAAVDRDLEIRALIDPVTQLRLAQAERLLRETPTTPGLFPFFLPDQPVVYVQSPPPVVILQQAAPQVAPAVAAEQEPVAVAPSPAPVSDVGEFVLVRRDGTQIRAVAFTRKDDRIVYITSDGLRHSLPLSELDSDATVRVNEERGTSLQLFR